MSEINFCNTKEQLTHLGEVVTGKVDGSPTGADIDTSTLPYTGQVRKTLPALEGEYEQSITDKEAEADAAIDSYRLLNKGPYASGITLDSKFEYINYNGESYFATNPPYTTTATTPDADGNLFAGGYTTIETVANKIGNPNLLSNSNFLTPSPDAITHPNATPESYVAGTQIFSGVYAGSSGVTVTLINGRVNCSAGSYEYRVANTNGLDRVPVFTSSVSGYDGNPVTAGVSHALVGNEYVVTVTPAAGSVFSVKLEQGGLPSIHHVSVESAILSEGSLFPRKPSERFADTVNLSDYLSPDLPFLDSLEIAIKSANGKTVVVPYGVYDAGSEPKLIEHPVINIRFEYCEIDFFGLTTNDESSPLWDGAAIDFNASEYMSIEGDVVFDFNNTYVYRGVRFREGVIKKFHGVKVKNIRPPVNWKDFSPPLISGAIVLGAPSNCDIANYGSDNTYKYYQDGTEIEITSSPSTPLSRGLDIQGTFNNTTLKNGDFVNVMMGLLLDTGTTLTVENTNVNGAVANAIYDLNCTDVTFKGGTIKSCKDQGITLSGRDKRISGFEFDNVEGRMISLHGGDVDGLSIHSNIARSSLNSISSTFVSIRSDAVSDTRRNVSVRGNVIDVAQCGTMFNLGLVDEATSITGNTITINQFPNNDPDNGAIVDSEGGLVGFDSNNIHYNDTHKFIRCFKGSSIYRNGNNPSNVALSNILASNVQGPIYEVPQQEIEGKSAEGEIFGGVNIRLPDNVGTKGLGGAYTVCQSDVNTFSVYQPATMGAYGFRWDNSNNGDYDCVYEVLKPSQASKTMGAVLRIDKDGNLHLKSGVAIIYDL